MEVVLAITTMITPTNIASCKILFPAPLRFGMDGNPPPPSSNFVVVGIFFSVCGLCANQPSRTTVATSNT
jgi:hypothetical protein